MRGEGYPTYIIIGDIHGEEYDFSRQMLQAMKHHLGCEYLVDTDSEGPEKEIEAVIIMKEKFGINIVGLENELVDGETWESMIGEGISKIPGMRMLALEKQEIFQLQGVVSLVPFLYIKHKVTEKLGVDIVQGLDPYQGDLGELLLQYKDEGNGELKIDTLTEQELVLLYRVILSTLQLVITPEDYANLDEVEMYVYETLMAKGVDIYSFSSYVEAEGKSEEMVKELIEERNRFGISMMHGPNDEADEAGKTPRIMIYGKEHIPGLLEGLNQAYKGQVNIYVAK